MRHRVAVFSILAFSVAVAAPTTSYRNDYSTFREDSAGLSVFANGFPAALGGDGAFVAVPIAVALMRDGKSITFTTESFILIDAQGNRVPAAGYRALNDNHKRKSFDQQLARTWPVNVGTVIAEKRQIASNFYSWGGVSRRVPRVELPPFTWFTDVLFFPRPPAGLGGVMTLSVAVGAEAPVEIRFYMNGDDLSNRPRRNTKS